ncbi:hypothetical protein AB1Y20_022905 [Prymnesium parvum]|uniref:Uncharacterized protein n=1 Tax=Prymnesium parvum TaxID=97485 RepID=A0AB34JCC0_PRYPA
MALATAFRVYGHGMTDPGRWDVYALRFLPSTTCTSPAISTADPSATASSSGFFCGSANLCFFAEANNGPRVALSGTPLFGSSAWRGVNDETGDIWIQVTFAAPTAVGCIQLWQHPTSNSVANVSVSAGNGTAFTHLGTTTANACPLYDPNVIASGLDCCAAAPDSGSDEVSVVLQQQSTVIFTAPPTKTDQEVAAALTVGCIEPECAVQTNAARRRLSSRRQLAEVSYDVTELLVPADEPLSSLLPPAFNITLIAQILGVSVAELSQGAGAVAGVAASVRVSRLGAPTASSRNASTLSAAAASALGIQPSAFRVVSELLTEWRIGRIGPR